MAKDTAPALFELARALIDELNARIATQQRELDYLLQQRDEGKGDEQRLLEMKAAVEENDRRTLAILCQIRGARQVLGDEDDEKGPDP